MPSAGTLLLFAGACALLAAIPGPNVLYIVATGITGGRRSAVRSVFGVHAATAVFVLAAAAGLTAVVVSSAVAFAVLKYAGAAYLIYLGIRALRSGPATAPVAGGSFRRSFAVGIANPKVAVFVAAFLPQFGSSAGELLVLGAVFLAVAVVLDLGWALLAGWLHRHARILRHQRVVTGPTYLALGTYAAAS